MSPAFTESQQPPCRRLLRCGIASAGFTLIELMVALSIAVVLMVVAAPDMAQYRKNSELAEAVGSFIVASNAAKSAALKTGRNAFIMANTGGWGAGWKVFVDNNWTENYEASDDDLVLERPALSSGFVFTATNTLGAGYLMFDGSGFPKSLTGKPTNGSLTMKNGKDPTNIYVTLPGRIRSCRPPPPSTTC